MKTAKKYADNLECGGMTPLSYGATRLAIQNGDTSPQFNLTMRPLSAYKRNNLTADERKIMEGV